MKLAFFFTLLCVCVNNSLVGAAITQPGCHQGIFSPNEGNVDLVNATESLEAQGYLDCAQQCLRKEGCEAIKYRNRLNIVNCQLGGNAGDTAERETSDGDEWTLYSLTEVESPLCIGKKPCKNGGKCHTNMCEPEGYSCKCNGNYYGEHCENEKQFVDLTFPDSADNYIDYGTIDKPIGAFTLTLWFKIESGFLRYPLVYYTINENETGLDTFFAAGQEGEVRALTYFYANVNGESINIGTLPVNDGYWHHLGYTWSGTTNDMLFLIDGVDRGRKSVSLEKKYIEPGGKLLIGKRDAGQTKNFIGSLSRLNLWSRVLTGEEIDAMSKTPGEEHGDVINWLDARNRLVGNILVTFPSEAHNTGKDMNYKVTLGTNWVSSQGPAEVIREVTACTWFKVGNGPAEFFRYNVSSEHTKLWFGYGGDDIRLYAVINGSPFLSSLLNQDVDSGWHNLCFEWYCFDNDAYVLFYYDGVEYTDIVKYDVNNTVIESGGNFTIGAKKDDSGMVVLDTSLRGEMSQLNIWSHLLTTNNIKGISSGGANLRGDLFAWGNVAGNFVGIITWNWIGFVPGYTVSAKRNEWCNHMLSEPCPGKYLARFGGNANLTSMAWRCYCKYALVDSKWGYDAGKRSTGYVTRDAELAAIN